MLSAAGFYAATCKKRKPIAQATVQPEISSFRFLIRFRALFLNGEKIAYEASLGILDVSFQWEW